MAVFKVVPPSKDKYEIGYIRKKIEYILQPSKILSNEWGGLNFLFSSEESIINQFYIVRNILHKQSCVPLMHFVFSLDGYYDEDIHPSQMGCIAYQICKMLARDQYQIIYAVHEDTNQLHTHFLLNTTNLYTGRQYQFYNRDLQTFLDLLETLLRCPNLWRGHYKIKLYR
ncbi:MAG: relaxase/mobilization nuclease domain-containing protein [Lachnospiraceae bacterium]|nr:relaxase/mobilization nuclease domain-containing protein [Lachnospiraceae bacterium]